MINSICVFCGSSVGKHESYINQARNLGQIIAEKKMTLIYGGGNIGVMREIADSALKHNGKVIGVMPQHIVDKEVAHHHITELHIVNSMHERKAMMAGLSDAFIALPGGFGTIDELFEVMTWNQLEIINKPTGLLNIEGYFDHLIKFIDHAVNEKFVRAEHKQNLIVETDANVLIQKLEKFVPQQAEKWIDRLKMDLI
jgi:uncharacterized protein (TIGR00730 family)